MGIRLLQNGEVLCDVDVVDYDPGQKTFHQVRVMGGTLRVPGRKEPGSVTFYTPIGVHIMSNGTHELADDEGNQLQIWITSVNMNFGSFGVYQLVSAITR